MVVWPPQTPYAERDGLWACQNTRCSDGMHVQMLRPVPPLPPPPPTPPPSDPYEGALERAGIHDDAL